ncbi:MAG: pilus assembly protein PilB [Oscillatoriophycideae cyanobacterium NC_groundwater_1537_Pr4_S-0.65um_50_18]|nr:pilus assembly protein PilB [Oscillatoriophycideae cyanobacterium NC_groundwater_1537_Pr4_S-0.65um_50_18]
MASPLDDRSYFRLSSTVQRRILSQFQGDWVDRLNGEQMFMLIDGILPFEACLYYQVLPLFLEGNRLNLGMVSPEDIPACEYVRRIISYLNYSLVPRQISSEAVQVVLTAYLNHIGEKQSLEGKRQVFSYGHHRYSNPRYGKEVQELTQNDRQTLIVDSPDDLNLPDPGIHLPGEPLSGEPLPRPQVALPQASPQADALQSLELESPIPDVSSTLPGTASSGTASSGSAALNPVSLGIASSATFQQKLATTLEASPLLKSLPTLEIQANYLTAPVETLATLSPKTMLQELLGRVLVGGIGRLYFESHVHHGRVLWSQNGVLQSVLEKLPLSVFQGVLDELKLMAKMPLQPVEQAKQVEIEYLYDRARVLLRFRFMPNMHGEEATLQVLRGAALKFYQQQQVTKLERDAMGIARQLQNKLKEIRDRAYSEPGLAGAKFEVLPALSQILRNLEDELEDLGINDR